jgi:hypothetical protein
MKPFLEVRQGASQALVAKVMVLPFCVWVGCATSQSDITSHHITHHITTTSHHTIISITSTARGVARATRSAPTGDVM